MSQQTLGELLYGKGAHANPLACVEDVPWELAGRRAEGFPHSIWQIVAHLNYWMLYELKRVRGEAPVYPSHAAESWPVESAATCQEEWNEAVKQFRDLLEQLAALAKSEPEALARKVDATHPDHAKHTSSLLAVLWQTLVHNSYHVGQIAVLRRALGAWPPRGGGDSW
jgi:uncharacterized damage-inducible protein DinB